MDSRNEKSISIEKPGIPCLLTKFNLEGKEYQAMSDAKNYKACIYARLSQEDGDKTESDSITSQKAMIREYISKHPEIEIVSEKVDDGYSGVNFDRPGFQEMMEEINAGKVNCVVVKDLSRFGRNYIEAGNYIEKTFPFLGVRFIAINDDYDSIERRQSDSLIVPFKNLINDAYCKDISVKIRTQLEIKRKKGQYTGPIPVYGYEKDPNDHNHLVPDPYAAGVVRSIFHWMIQGMSITGIADQLNAEGELCPMEYKKAKGIWVPTQFCAGTRATWSHMTVRRILKNEVYTGVLVQGKSATPNHKIRQCFPKDKEEWIRVENTHEPIIDRKTFDTVQLLMKKDVKSSQLAKCILPFSGYLICEGCGQAMTRQICYRSNKQFRYYICSTHKNKKTCSPHQISEDKLTKSVLEAIQTRIASIIDMNRLVDKIDMSKPRKVGVGGYDRQIGQLRGEIERNQSFKMQLYENLQQGIISKKDYDIFRTKYDKRIQNAEQAITKIGKEREKMLNQEERNLTWMEDFINYGGITEIDRKVIVELIDHIVVYGAKQIEVVFRYQDEYDLFLQFVEEYSKGVNEDVENESESNG